MARVTDGRGLSTAVGYVLNIAVITLLLSVLLFAAGGLVEDQRERVADAELSVVGERLASDLTSADRLVGPDTTDVTVRAQLPRGVAGDSYRITVQDGYANGTTLLRLRTGSLSRPVTVPVVLDADVAGAPVSVRGGNVRIKMVDPDGDDEPELEVSADG